MLKDLDTEQPSEEQKKNQEYLQYIKTQIGIRLNRENQEISYNELDNIIGKVNLSRHIQSGQTTYIRSETRRKLNDLLTKFKEELELLLQPLEDQNKNKQDSNSFGKQLQRARQNLGYTNVEQLSNKINSLVDNENIKVSPHIIKYWEYNKGRPSAKRYKILQQILGNKCPRLPDLKESIESNNRRTFTQEEENKKQEITGKLQDWLLERKNDDTTKDEYIHQLMELWNQSPQEFQGFEFTRLASDYPNKDFEKMNKTLTGKRKGRRVVKPFKHLGSQEQKLPMLLTLIAQETGDSVDTFLETCVGTGQFLLQAPYQNFAVADLDPNITNFLQVVKDDPHNLEVFGRLLKAHLKKRQNIKTKDWQQNWNKQWKDTLERVNPEKQQPTPAVETASKSVHKALVFLLYRNAKLFSEHRVSTENY